MNKRRKKLIQPRLQLRIVGAFLGISALGFLLQGLLLTNQLSRLAETLPTGGGMIQEEIPGIVIETFLISFGVLLPITLAVGIVATFRIAGPAYRFREHLRAIARGEEVGPCVIRESDQLQDLCEAINAAVEKLQQAGAKTPETSQEPSQERAA